MISNPHLKSGLPTPARIRTCQYVAYWANGSRIWYLDFEAAKTHLRQLDCSIRSNQDAMTTDIIFRPNKQLAGVMGINPYWSTK